MCFNQSSPLKTTKYPGLLLYNAVDVDVDKLVLGGDYGKDFSEDFGVFKKTALQPGL